MGKLILCSGKLASRPYHFSLSNTNVYTIEEMCYYIYNNIYAIHDELYQRELVDWLLNEVEMTEIAYKLDDLIIKNHSLKDIVVSILCSADYYDEKEIKHLIKIMDQIDHLSLIRKNIIKADNYLRYKRYANARRLYEQIIKDKEAITLTPEEYGDIKHNLATIYLHTVSYKEAAKVFLEAYNSNRKNGSLESYLYALKLGNFEEEFEQAVITFEVPSILIEEIKTNIELKLLEVKDTDDYQKLRKLKTYLQEQKISSFNNVVDQIIDEWKQEYRHEIVK